ncbi:DUF6192 family protein [Streptomyces sp. NRRL S-237]|uniref:DUF6192 family protein n=1 Tax=Streptomyces sp. NRRL S-237 TaxID=1463895 RepID=UPI0004C53FC5|nr:DUF6192 family protein [Streptomyces sp. NRRL S-237]
MPEDHNEVGSVSQQRYEQIVAELREVVGAQTLGQFVIGDRSLEIEPIRDFGGRVAGERTPLVRDSLVKLAADIGLAYGTVASARWTASRWPQEHRRPDVSFKVHRILAQIESEEERFAAIGTPPEGKSRWTPDEASRRVGRQVETPVTPEEKVSAIHALARNDEVAAAVTTELLRRPTVAAQVSAEDKVKVVEELTRDEKVAAAVTTGLLRRPTVAAQVSREDKVRAVEELTRDESVATEVTTGLLRRPDVAFKAMSDDTARHQVNHAQVERGRQAREHFERTSPVAPAVRRIERTMEFIDLVAACHSFVASAGRTVPGLRDRQLGEDERAIVHENVARVRATLDWIETAVDTGKVDVDGELARLLSGQ